MDKNTVVYGFDSNREFDMLIISDNYNFAVVWIGEHKITESITSSFKEISKHAEQTIDILKTTLKQMDPDLKVKLMTIGHQSSLPIEGV